MLERIKAALKSYLPVYREYNNVRRELGRWKRGLYPPGHYYSPIISEEAMAQSFEVDYEVTIPGIDLQEEEQFALLKKLAAYYKEDIFPPKPTSGYRYYFNNDYFSYSDALFLNMMMRNLRPKRIIEVGSGFSSAVMMDTNQFFLDGACRLTFIEPYPDDRLNALSPNLATDELIKDFVQNVPLDVFRELRANDILFIDSSHVSKFRSDLNYLLFEVVPTLHSGVIIHFHDIFFPFEYPMEWIKQGRSWNEAYLVRAFLQNNAHYEILLFTSFLEGKHRPWFESNMPMCLKKHELIALNGTRHLMNTTGQSLYIRKK